MSAGDFEAKRKSGSPENSEPYDDINLDSEMRNILRELDEVTSDLERLPGGPGDILDYDPLEPLTLGQNDHLIPFPGPAVPEPLPPASSAVQPLAPNPGQSYGLPPSQPAYARNYPQGAQPDPGFRPNQNAQPLPAFAEPARSPDQVSGLGPASQGGQPSPSAAADQARAIPPGPQFRPAAGLTPPPGPNQGGYSAYNQGPGLPQVPDFEPSPGGYQELTQGSYRSQAADRGFPNSPQPQFDQARLSGLNYGPQGQAGFNPARGQNVSPYPPAGRDQDPAPGYNQAYSQEPPVQTPLAKNGRPFPQAPAKPPLASGPVLTARRPVPVPRDPNEAASAAVLTGGLDTPDGDQGHEVIDLVEEVDDFDDAEPRANQIAGLIGAQGGPRAALSSGRAGDLSCQRLSELIEAAVERALRRFFPER